MVDPNSMPTESGRQMEPSLEPHEQANRDDDDDDDDEKSEAQDYGILNEVLKSPYYFACAFISIGVFLQASMPFVNWYMIWFLLTQAIIMGAFGLLCFGLGLITPLHYDFVVPIVNMIATACTWPNRLAALPHNRIQYLPHMQSERSGQTSS